MRKIIVGITGASGVQLGVAVLRALAEAPDAQSILVMSEGAKVVLARECAETYDEVAALADAVYDAGDLAAPISSGSYRTDGMIVALCSMKTPSAPLALTQTASLARSYSLNALLSRCCACCIAAAMSEISDGLQPFLAATLFHCEVAARMLVTSLVASSCESPQTAASSARPSASLAPLSP